MHQADLQTRLAIMDEARQIVRQLLQSLMSGATAAGEAAQWTVAARVTQLLQHGVTHGLRRTLPGNLALETLVARYPAVRTLHETVTMRFLPTLIAEGLGSAPQDDEAPLRKLLSQYAVIVATGIECGRIIGVHCGGSMPADIWVNGPDIATFLEQSPQARALSGVAVEVFQRELEGIVPVALSAPLGLQQVLRGAVWFGWELDATPTRPHTRPPLLEAARTGLSDGSVPIELVRAAERWAELWSADLFSLPVTERLAQLRALFVAGCVFGYLARRPEQAAIARDAGHQGWL